ncbi:MAG: hypothetical protein H3Z53_11250 [archaeon]|nr:hypothetical protein [archaeon]MCP8314928.1 hypothetical protein [archaeon]
MCLEAGLAEKWALLVWEDIKVPSCAYCNRDANNDSGLCEHHEFALFQVTEILTEFMKSNNPPEWLLAGIRELGWIFQHHPRTAAFINVAIEVADRFVIERVNSLHINDVRELNYTRLPQGLIISVLEEAYIVKKDGDLLFPGPLTRRLINVRDLGYPLNSPEQREKALEYQGILAVSLLRSMLRHEFRELGEVEEGMFVPQGALAIMTLLAIHALSSGEKLEVEVSDLTWDAAFRSIPTRQEKKMRRIMAGLLDGVTKMIHNINYNNRPELKDSVLEYLQNLRGRFRERQRIRPRT